MKKETITQIQKNTTLRIELENGIAPEDLKKFGETKGRLMWDICNCDRKCCRDKEAFIDLLSATADEIIERFKQ